MLITQHITPGRRRVKQAIGLAARLVEQTSDPKRIPSQVGMGAEGGAIPGEAPNGSGKKEEGKGATDRKNKESSSPAR